MIKLKKVSKKFDDNFVLKDIDLDLYEGNIYGLIGRNGSGKTMLLNTICGFIKPTSGEVLVDGVNIYENKTFISNARALIEHPKFLGNLTGYQNLELLAGINNKIGKNEIEDALKVVDLYSEKDKIYSKYSLGMKQKLGIAQVIMENPKVMIFDEPFNGLDEKSADKIRKFIKNIKNDKIIIIATHIKDDIEMLCDFVYKIDGGILKNNE